MTWSIPMIAASALLLFGTPALARPFDVAACLAHNGEQMRSWCESRARTEALTEARLARHHCRGGRQSADMRKYCLAIERNFGCPCYEIEAPSLRLECVRELGPVSDCFGNGRPVRPGIPRGR